MAKCDHCRYKDGKKEATYVCHTYYQDFHLCTEHAKKYPHKYELEKLPSYKKQLLEQKTKPEGPK